MFGLFSPATLGRRQPIVFSDWMTLLLSGITLILGWLWVRTGIADRRKQRQLDLIYAQLQQYAQQLEGLEAVREQSHTVWELQDLLGHSLAALTIQLQMALKLQQVDPEQSQRALLAAHQLSLQSLREVRRSLRAFAGK
jgi:signal transduction histidine kinase